MDQAEPARAFQSTRHYIIAAMLCASWLGIAGCSNSTSARAQAAPSPTPTTAPRSAGTFANPIVRSISAGDPWVIRYGGYYYFTATFPDQSGLWVWKSRTLTGLDDARKFRVWQAPKSGPQSREIWAPELHHIAGRWYLYFTASDGRDENHRIYVLQSKADDPLGPYLDCGRVDPELESYAIDASLLKMPDGSLYLMYAASGLWIVPLESPLRVKPGARRVRFAEPSFDWEAAWARQDHEWRKQSGGWIEAPEQLTHDGRTFVVYSAGHTSTPEYRLGLLEFTGGDVMNPSSWHKFPEPVFAPYSSNGGSVYTTGHCCFTTSPDGSEEWLVYHARDKEWDARNRRTVRTQPFTWNADGLPNFGRPVPRDVPIRKPSGERD